MFDKTYHMRHIKWIKTAWCWMFILLTTPLLHSQNFTDSKGLKQGKWVEKDEQGNIKYEGTFKNDKPIGSFTFYYPSKAIQSKIEYDQNRNSAVAIFFHDNGQKKADGAYLNQQKNGRWVYYNSLGTMISEEQYIQGKKEGLAVNYFPDGKKAALDSFHLDQRQGICIKYYDNGQKRIEANYEEDMTEGRYIEYFMDGKIKAQGKYLDGVKSGTWEYFHESGEKHYKELYTNGKRTELIKWNGVFEEFYPGEVEILKERVQYKDGKKHGAFVEFYPIGEWKFKTVSADQSGLPGAQDEVVRYFDGEKVKREGSYWQDVLDGEVYLFDEQGNQTQVEKYQKGVKIGSGQ